MLSRGFYRVLAATSAPACRRRAQAHCGVCDRECADHAQALCPQRQTRYAELVSSALQLLLSCCCSECIQLDREKESIVLLGQHEPRVAKMICTCSHSLNLPADVTSVFLMCLQAGLVSQGHLRMNPHLLQPQTHLPAPEGPKMALPVPRQAEQPAEQLSPDSPLQLLPSLRHLSARRIPPRMPPSPSARRSADGRPECRSWRS